MDGTIEDATGHRLRLAVPSRTPLLAGLLLGIGVVLGAWNVVAAARDRADTAAGQALLLQVEGLLSALKDVETGERGFLLVGEESFLEPYEFGRAAIATKLGELSQVEAAAPGPLRSLRDAAVAMLGWTADAIALRRTEGAAAAIRKVNSGGGKRLMDTARAAAANAQGQVRERLATLDARANRRALWLNTGSSVAVLGATFLLGSYALARRRAERRARSLLDGVMENAPVGLGFLDRRLRLGNANRALVMLGERVLGAGAAAGAALPEEVRAQIEPKLRAVLATGRAEADVEVSVHPQGPGGPLRHLLLGFFPLRDGRAERAVDGVGLVASDITLRRRIEQRLIRSEARLRLTIDSVPQLAWMTDPTGAILWYNRRWYDYTGATPEAMQGWGWKSVHHPEHVDGVIARFQAAIDAGESWEDTFPLRAADGTYRWFLSRALPLREAPDEDAPAGDDASPRLIGWFGTNTDITEMREAEAALVAAKAAAEDANRAKSQFLANMSHELRTPLSAVIGYSEMLEEDATEIEGAEAFRDDLGKINANARHLLSLINDVLDLSKIEAGKMELQPEDFDAATLLREVASTVDALIGKKGNTLEIVGADDLGTMHSDPVKLRQCLFNLLGNAAKFTEGGRITLSAERVGDNVQFRVADSGIGMTEEQLQRLFTRFSQADSSTTRRFGGTGLGLAITQAFVNLLGGVIEVASRPGEGTTFTIKLPADVRLNVLAAAPDVALAHAELGPEDGAAGLVLVVDDDPATRDLLTRFLRREGFAVRTAPDGEAGLRMARELRPVAILLDVMMPRLDGWAVLSALKADPAFAETPVVMVTVVQERGLAFSLGAADYLNKPVQWAVLKRVLDRYREQPSPGLALIVDDDAAQRTELRPLLEAEGWIVEEAADGRAALARMTVAPTPRLLLVDVEAPDGGDGFALIRELQARPEWRSLPIIALTEGKVDEAELRQLRPQVRGVVPADAGIPEDLVAELRRLAGSGIRGGDVSTSPDPGKSPDADAAMAPATVARVEVKA